MEINTTDDRKEQAHRLLEKHFGYNKFRKGQWEVIDSILSKKHAIAIFPTGGGKSLCFQLPALMMPRTTVVIAPLLSLMKDQVDSLVENGIVSSFISSALSDHEAQGRV